QYSLYAQLTAAPEKNRYPNKIRKTRNIHDHIPMMQLFSEEDRLILKPNYRDLCYGPLPRNQHGASTP
ncbi:MAG TPA: hypothetical protein PKH40_06260, partial [Treponemataceae bacterium]|nr:hypothetical protein [Treponemataceae bacterium]